MRHSVQPRGEEREDGSSCVGGRHVTAVFEPPEQGRPNRASNGGCEFRALRLGQVGRGCVESFADVGVDPFPQRWHHRPAMALDEVGLGKDAVAGEVFEQAGDEGKAMVLSGCRHDLHRSQECVSQEGIEVVVVDIERGA